MTLLWLLTGSVLANIAIWSGQKMAPSIAMALVTLGLALGWVNNGPVYYVAHPRSGEFHTTRCIQVRDAIRLGEHLDPYATAADAREAGLVAHHCVQEQELVATLAGAK